MKNKAPRKFGLTIGDISGRTGLAPSAIRFYEEQGLVHPFRTDSGQRRFDRADIRRL
ncbi:MerR family DNA-binding transcriptional regulator, partial [Roseobacter sp.]|uniref:MerR family DNA-binding transcriptional regulator n=1 Tax=Roseobacter sp. TaxID=1907202 RepID=UPI0032995A66